MSGVFDVSDFLPDDEEFTNEPLDMNRVKDLLPTYTAEKLCEMIVCSRYLSFDQQIITDCMEELARRRMNGDTFAFEAYINQATQELPQLQPGMPDLRVVLSQLANKR